MSDFDWKLTPRQRKIRTLLLQGPHFIPPNDAPPDREVPASLIRELVVLGVPIELHNAIIRGEVDLKGLHCNAKLVLRGCSIDDLDASGAHFHQAFDLGDSEGRPSSVGGLFLLTGATFERGLYLPRLVHLAADMRPEWRDAGMTALKVKRGIIATKARFLGGMSLDGAIVQGVVHYEGANIGENASFTGLRVNGQAVFESVHFGGYTAFMDSIFTQGVSFEPGSGVRRSPELTHPSEEWPETVFTGLAAFDRMSVGGNLRCRYAKFHGSASFIAIRVAGQASFSGAKFHDQVNLQSADFGSDLFIGDLGEHQARCASEFVKGLQLDGGRVSGNLICRHVLFKGRVSFSGLEILGFADLQGSSFNSEFLFDGSRIGAGLFAERSHFYKEITLADTVIGRAALLIRTRFRAQAVFDRAVIRGPLFAERALFRGDASFGDASIAGGALFPRATFGANCHMYGLRVPRRLYLSDARFLSPKARLMLQNSQIGTLELPKRMPSRVVLDGSRIKRVLGPVIKLLASLRSVDEKRTASDELAPPDRAAYSELERALRRQGDDALADEVQFVSRSAESPWLLERRQYLRWLADQLFRFFASYGMTPLRSFLWCVSWWAYASLYMWALTFQPLSLAGILTSISYGFRITFPIDGIADWPATARQSISMPEFYAHTIFIRFVGLGFWSLFLGTITGFFRYVRRF